VTPPLAPPSGPVGRKLTIAPTNGLPSKVTSPPNGKRLSPREQPISAASAIDARPMCATPKYFRL